MQKSQNKQRIAQDEHFEKNRQKMLSVLLASKSLGFTVLEMECINVGYNMVGFRFEGYLFYQS